MRRDEAERSDGKIYGVRQVIEAVQEELAIAQAPVGAQEISPEEKARQAALLEAAEMLM